MNQREGYTFTSVLEFRCLLCQQLSEFFHQLLLTWKQLHITVGKAMISNISGHEFQYSVTSKNVSKLLHK